MTTSTPRSRLRVLALVLLAFSGWAEQGIAQVGGGTGEAGIREQIAALETALGAQDAAGYAALYVLDATSVSGDGPRAEGRQAIREDIEGVFSAMPADTPPIRMSIRSIRFLDDGAALVDLELAGTRARATYVMVLEDESWLIAAARLLPPERG